MRLDQLGKMLDRMEVTSPGPWDTMVDPQGRIALTSSNSEILASDISVEDAWYISHTKEDIKMLIDEVLDLRRLITDIHMLIADKTDSGIVSKYIESVMSGRVG